MMKKTETNKTKLLFFVLFITLTLAFPARAQVTIGTDAAPDPASLLDLKDNKEGEGTSTKGLLLPRVALKGTNDAGMFKDHDAANMIAGMFVYNTVTTTNNPGYDVTPGTYFNDGTHWVRIIDTGNRWFYMPSFNLPLEDPDNPDNQDLKFDLYAEYLYQFGGIVTQNDANWWKPAADPVPNEGIPTTSSPDTNFKTLANSPGVILYQPGELIFYVSAYSQDVITVTGLDENGVLYYHVESPIVPDGSFINVMFRVKSGQ
jgi:hypothetical protein